MDTNTHESEIICVNLCSSVAKTPLRTQLLKWIGNKQRFAAAIISHFPAEFENYHEPFLGSGAVLATLAPARGVASDCFAPLMEIWRTLSQSLEELKRWYSDRFRQFAAGDKTQEYERIKASYNVRPNGPDLLFLCRSCYGGVMRFRQRDGFCSTPCGSHDPISPESFARRVDLWHGRVRGVQFICNDYQKMLPSAKAGDLVYCDPPYSDSQTILYGAQRFSLARLFELIADCKSRGVYVALSIDGKKRSGRHVCELNIPPGLFEREVFLDCGRSMLKRFQCAGESLESERVQDRLLLTY